MAARPLFSLSLFLLAVTVSFAANADDSSPLPQLPKPADPTDPRAPISVEDQPKPPEKSEDVAARGGKPKHCIGWGIAGALGGAAVGYYAVYGIATAAGVDFFNSPPAFYSSVAAEGVGAIAGPVLSCRLSEDPRIIPAASFVVAGSMVGGTALGAGTYLLLVNARPFGDEGDNPVLSGLTLLFGVVAGAVGGGYLGYRVSEAREPASRWDEPRTKPVQSTWSFAPLVAKDRTGLTLGGSF